MIDRVSGVALAAGATWVVVEVAGVGLRALCTPATAAAVRPGGPCELFTTLVVREDSLTLYGFATSAERDSFQLVQTASGVGPKVALSIVSVLSPADLVEAITRADISRITSVPGIGPKGAQKLVIELKDKVGLLAAEVSELGVGEPAPSSEWREQVMAGLAGLGWSSRDAEAACERVAPLVADDPDTAVPVLMRAALASLAR